METRYKLPQGAQLNVAARLFDAISTIGTLTRPAEEGRRIPFRRLYDFATDGAADDALERAVNADPVLGRDLARLLARTCRHHLPRVAAASSGAITHRVIEGCRIRFEVSRAEPEQTYVIIELTDRDAPPPTTLFLRDGDGRSRKVPLPEGRDGVIQLLEGRDSDLLRGLRDIKTELFLR